MTHIFLRYKATLPLLLLAVFALFAPLLATGRAEAAKREDLVAILERRSINCWPEGVVFEDLVIGARGKLTFFYIDSKLGNALQRLKTSGNEGMPDDRMPQILTQFSGKFMTQKDTTLFVVYIEGYKPWVFDTRKILVDGEALADEAVVTGILANPEAELLPGENELPSDYMGAMSFIVKNEILKPGREIAIGYGEDVTNWKVPGRNE